MTKQEKIASLSNAMTRSERNANDSVAEYFYHFTDEAPQELRDLFIDNFAIDNKYYEIFDTAITIMDELCQDAELTEDTADEAIYERSANSAPVYTHDLLALLDNNNQDDIAGYVVEHQSDIAQACIYWYDQQVTEACFHIKNWIDADDNE